MENRIALASDHAGFALKQYLVKHLKNADRQVLDLGPTNENSVDYPDFADRVADALKEGKAGFGVLICGTGVGISIAANRHRHIRAALCHDVTSTRLCREHNDANVLVMGGRLIGTITAQDCVDVFLSTAFEGGRHARRVEKLA